MKLFIPAMLTIALTIGCNETTKTEFVSAKLAPFKNAANGKMGQEVIATWRNVGDAPVRAVDANIKLRDPNGNIIDSFTYTIYAEFDDAPGVLPGETYTTKAGNGFKPPGFQGLPGYTPADSVEVTITKSSKTSGM
jgi:hypothetical protein